MNPEPTDNGVDSYAPYAEVELVVNAACVVSLVKSKDQFFLTVKDEVYFRSDETIDRYGIYGLSLEDGQVFSDALLKLS